MVSATREPRESSADVGESGATATIPEANETDLNRYEDEQGNLISSRRWDDWLDFDENNTERHMNDDSDDIIDVDTVEHGNAEIISHDRVEWLRVGLESLNKHDLIKLIQRSHERYDVNPTTCIPVSVPLTQSPSTVLFVVEKDDLSDVGDVTRDCFSPWAAIEKGESRGTTAECRWYLFDESGITRHFRNKRDLLKCDGKMALWLNTQRLSRCMALKRTVAAIYNLSVLPATGKRSKEALVSNVLVAYSFEGGEPPQPSEHGNSRGAQVQFPTFVKQKMVDFTFSTCSMQLGVLAYPSTMFRRTTGSGKQPYVELGYVLCAVPDSETMTWLGMELNKEFTRLDPLFRISALITDREKALRHILKGGTIFEDAVELHCSVHWKQNCQAQCGPAAAALAYNYIFGSENVVGLLDSAVTSQEFDDQMRASVIPVLPLRQQGKTWLEGQISILWEHYSLAARLKAGFGLHPVTTNSVENINRWLQEYLGPRNSIQAVVNALLSRNSDTMRSFLGAVLGCSSDFSPRFGLRVMTYIQAKTATHEDKYVAAKQYGLEEIVGSEQRDLNLPQFIFDGRSGVSRDTFLVAVRRTKIYPHPDVYMANVFLAEDGDQALSYKIQAKEGDIVCGCMRSKFSAFCHHIAAYVIHLPEAERPECWRLLGDKRKESADERRSRLANAAKDGRKPSKRRGTTETASNHVRKYVCRRPLAVTLNST